MYLDAEMLENCCSKKDKNTKIQKGKIQNTKYKYKIHIAKKCQKSSILRKVIFGFFGIGCRNEEKGNFQFQFKISVLIFFQFSLLCNTCQYVGVLGRRKS